MTSLDDVWGPSAADTRRQPPAAPAQPPQHPPQHPPQQRYPAQQPAHQRPGGALQSKNQHGTAAAVAPADAAAQLAASNTAAVNALHQALLELRAELDSTRRRHEAHLEELGVEAPEVDPRAPPVAAVGAAVGAASVRAPRPDRQVRGDGLLAVVVAVGFALLIVTVSLVGAAVCRTLAPPPAPELAVLSPGSRILRA